MRVASIDIGTNSFLCLVAEVTSGKVQNVLHDEVEIVRIGEGVGSTGEFSAAALQRAELCLSRFQKAARALGVDKISAVATSAARDARNGYLLVEMGRALGFEIKIIDGKTEAELTFKGVQSNPKFGDDIAVIDVGGGSTEITVKESGHLLGQSFDVGGVRLTEKYVSAHPVLAIEITKIAEFCRSTFSKMKAMQNKKFVGVAGTPTTLAAVLRGIEYNQEILEGHELTLNQIEALRDRLASMNLSERSSIKGLEPKRADIIVAGATVLAEALRALGGQSLFVSTRGIRYGLACEV